MRTILYRADFASSTLEQIGISLYLENCLSITIEIHSMGPFGTIVKPHSRVG
jgi:hypothetical protein